MLGKNSKPSSPAQVASKGRPNISTVSREPDSDDDEEGRSASFKSKRRKLVTETRPSASSVPDAKSDSVSEDKQPLSINSNANGTDQSAQIELSQPMAAKSQKCVAATYLDELLAQKAKKRKKHKKNKGGDADDQQR